MQPEAILPRGYGRGVRAGAGRAAARLRRAGWQTARYARARPSTSFLASWRQVSTRKAPEPIAGSRISRSRIRAHQLVVGPLRHHLRAFAGVQGQQGVEVDDHGGAGSLPGAHRDGAARGHHHLREIEGRAAGGLPAGDVDQPGAVVGAGQAGGSAKFQRVSVLSIPNNKITDVAYVYWIEPALFTKDRRRGYGVPEICSKIMVLVQTAPQIHGARHERNHSAVFAIVQSGGVH